MFGRSKIQFLTRFVVQSYNTIIFHRGGKNFRFFDASRLLPDWLCLDGDKLIIGILKIEISSPSAECYRKRLLILCCTSMCTEHTCAICLCLSSDKMAAMASTKPIILTPTSLKATVWQHFEFHEAERRIDKTYTVQFVRCVELNLNTSATQLIWETTLPPRIEREAATCCRCQPENNWAGGGTALTKL